VPSPPALKKRTRTHTHTQRIGADVAPGAGPAETALAAVANVPALLFYGGADGASEVSSKWVTHCVEEMGNLPRFLPELWRNETGEGAGAGAAPSSSAAAAAATRAPLTTLRAAAVGALLLVAWLV
jgi:hypothetical protein